MSEIRVDSISNESNTGGPVLSGVTEFSGQQYFIPPKGTTAERPSDCPPGSIRFNTDSSHLEYWNGLVWLEFEASNVELGHNNTATDIFAAGDSAGLGTRALFGGGYAPGDVNTIDYISVSSFGDAIDFGDLIQKRRPGGAVSSSTRSVFWAGRTGPPPFEPTNVIDFVTISSTGNAQDFGDNATKLQFGVAVGNATRGVYGGGYEASPLSDVTNSLYYITIASTGDSVDFGDVSSGYHHYGAGCASAVRGIFAAGRDENPAGPINTIDFITISTLGNTLEFGDLTTIRFGFSGCSNAVRGVFGGGSTTSPSVTKTNVIDFITIASTGNATDFGDRTIADFDNGAACSPTRAVFSGDYQVVTMDAVEIMTTGNAVDFGDLTQGRLQNAGTSNGHGGL